MNEKHAHPFNWLCFFKSCKADYLTSDTDLSRTIAERCEALVVFSKCLSQYDSETDKEFMLFKQVSIPFVVGVVAIATTTHTN